MSNYSIKDNTVKYIFICLLGLSLLSIPAQTSAQEPSATDKSEGMEIVPTLECWILNFESTTIGG